VRPSCAAKDVSSAQPCKFLHHLFKAGRSHASSE
jgi:hypothetical protein